MLENVRLTCVRNETVGKATGRHQVSAYARVFSYSKHSRNPAPDVCVCTPSRLTSVLWRSGRYTYGAWEHMRSEYTANTRTGANTHTTHQYRHQRHACIPIVTERYCHSDSLLVVQFDLSVYTLRIIFFIYFYLIFFVRRIRSEGVCARDQIFGKFIWTILSSEFRGIFFLFFFYFMFGFMNCVGWQLLQTFLLIVFVEFDLWRKYTKRECKYCNQHSEALAGTNSNRYSETINYG